ncbi:MAG: PEP-CTERM sorting domain-containing protein [Spirulina sp. SIO3F2]|nr:PEP-CTERM sorting domain-containing protein [Spirulina sp. SIO3F2]
MNIFKTALTLTTVLAGWTFWATPISANPIDYDESIDGDLRWLQYSPSPLVLGVGDNHVRGEKTFDLSSGIKKLDFDTFSFVVPEYSFLNAIFLDIEPTSGTAQFLNSSYRLGFFASPSDDRPASFSDAQNVPLPAVGSQLFALDLPLGPGKYLFEHHTIGGIGYGKYKTASYELTLNVMAAEKPETIPEPTMILGLVTIAGIGFSLRRSPQPQ